jgi:serine O-acetyltransferase
MISSKADLKRFLEIEFLRNEKSILTFRESIMSVFDHDYIWDFIKHLRNYEYYLNNGKQYFFTKIMRKFHLYKYKSLSYKLGFSIPPNVFGPGLRIPHYGTIIVHPFAKIGTNCVIQAGVNIGIYNRGVLIIGDNVYIGPGAKIFGGIRIGNNIAIGANSVVNNSFLQSNVTIAGVPSGIIRYEKADER